MKLPNGYGSVYKLRGNRRNPWVARKTLGWNDKAQPIYYYVGYYPTKQEALSALGAFNLDPVYSQKLSLNDVFLRWSEEHYPTISEGLQRVYSSAWRVFAPLYHVNISLVKIGDLQMCLDSSGKNAPTLKQAKIVVRQVFRYAEKYELCAPMQSRLDFLEIRAGNPNKHEKSAFTPDEVKALWKSEDPFAKYVLILLYTGLRASELLALRPEDINAAEGFFSVRKSKTPSGVRDVPIHPRIMPYMASYEPFPRQYNMFRKSFVALCPEHTPHECRHTFVTRLVEAGVDPRYIKKMVGHADDDVTDIYTHIGMETLKNAVSVLP